ncbi:MAG: ral nucleoside transport system permease protein [Gemmatimonadaceae bacterium]|nr:ral nucleoside transport system permease protein [Gemmatimonadaceae bacterium]
MTASPAATDTMPTFAATPWRERAEEALIPPLVALLVALICGDLLILSYGQSPAVVYRLLLEGTWGNAYGFGQVLYKATTLAFTGLAVSFGLRAGLFNIGGESQLAAGGFAAALMGLVLPGGTPLAIALVLCMAAAGCAGGAVGAVPAYLKTRFGAHEVIVTIMLNFIVLALLNWFIAGHLHVPETLHTPEIHAGVLPRLADLDPRFHGSAANLGLLVALIVAVAVWFYLFRARGGYELRAVGLQPEAAEYGGINVGRVWMKALTFSGAIAGMGGINYVLGYKHYYEDGFASGAGFMGIAVALVGRNHPFGVLLAAFFFATLSQGGLAIHAFVPKQMMDVLQGVVIIAVATSVPEVRRVLRSARRRSDA